MEYLQVRDDVALAYEATLESWARALELRDVEPEGHSARVTDLALRLARAVGMGDRDLVHVRRGALLHDIGKMGVPDRILFKLGPLTEDEWDILRRHPAYAYDLLSPIPCLRPALDIPYCHHERWDGTGYPQGLRGTEIPLAARVFTVVDVWDAMYSDRCYRPAWSRDEVNDYLNDQAGAHLDPQVVQAFFGLLH
jgi:HD-GYP domain-containing protein (c-di-GMP phosphodiesterase class II)